VLGQGKSIAHSVIYKGDYCTVEAMGEASDSLSAVAHLIHVDRRKALPSDVSQHLHERGQSRRVCYSDLAAMNGTIS
jgi:hypothetical protein